MLYDSEIMKKKTLLIIFAIIFSFTFSVAASAKILNVVAAENFYAEVAKEIGGSYVQVTSILSNPNQDPHLFSASPAVAKMIAKADIVIYNGINYDPWAERLLAATQKKPAIIVISELVGGKAGDNPHLWYNPNTMLLYAKTLTATLINHDPQHESYYAQQLADFNQSYQRLSEKIATLRQQYRDTPVIATEPVFGYMADALGLKMYASGFQLSVMNDIAPSASQTRDFENDLRSHQVRVLIYNNQVINPVTNRMQLLAKDLGIPIVGVSETEPVGKTYVQWMLDQLNDLQQALSHPSPKGD